MKRFNATLLILALVLLGLSLAAPALADQWNKKTYMTFNTPVELPNGMILQPGEYVFKLLDSPSNRHIVQVFNKDENHIFATILAIPNYRLEPTGKTVVRFWETPAEQPQPVRAWFYPGDNFGQEFHYPKTRAVELTQVTKETVPALTVEEEKTLTEATPREEAAVTPKAEEKPAPPPAAEAAPAPMPEQPAEKETLPASASDWPLVALLGLFSLGLAAALRVLSNRLA